MGRGPSVARACLLMGVSVLVLPACSGTDRPATVPEPEARSSAVTDPRVGELEAEVRELTDRLEVMQARLETMSDTLAELLDAPESVQRGRAVPQTGGPLEQAIRRQVDVARAAEIYRDAQVAYARGNIEESRAMFEQVYRADPLGDLADNALFWIGESYFVMGRFDAAIRVFDKVVTDYSDQNRAPDALLRIAQTHVRKGDLALARETFQKVIDRFGWSSAANVARQEIERIRY